ncbi:MAG: hypothetical protein ACPGO3_04270 [Magnetospiraceae bacterium]
MRSCDTCPSGADCAGIGLHPVLVRVYDLYQSGITDKFDLLFALSEEDEAVIERFGHRVGEVCWTKAALLAIVEILSRVWNTDAPTSPEAETARVLSAAREAFARFPWRLEDLVAEAPALHELILETCPDDSPFADLPKRGFAKICKEVAWS